MRRIPQTLDEWLSLTKEEWERFFMYHAKRQLDAIYWRGFYHGLFVGALLLIGVFLM